MYIFQFGSGYYKRAKNTDEKEKDVIIKQLEKRGANKYVPSFDYHQTFNKKMFISYFGSKYSEPAMHMDEKELDDLIKHLETNDERRYNPNVDYDKTPMFKNSKR